jgi:SAM-dependent methyltransferase
MTMRDFRKRSTEPELMDAADVSFEELRGCLADLARVNELTLAYRPTLAFLDRLLATGRLQGRIEVLDVGSGYGDTLRRIDAWAARRGVELALTGVDLQPWSRRAAADATPPSSKITWVTADAFEYLPPRGIDVVVSSLFTHHLPDVLVTKFLAWMEEHARIGWFVNDLRRHPVPFHSFRVFAKLAGFHRFVQHDGPISIARAFVPTEWQCYVASAGLEPASVEIERAMPFRLTVARVKER